LFSGYYAIKEEYLTRHWILGTKDFAKPILVVLATYAGWGPHDLFKVPSSCPAHHIIIPTDDSFFTPFFALFSLSIKVNALDTSRSHLYCTFINNCLFFYTLLLNGSQDCRGQWS
jgi:hypothetical protein